MADEALAATKIIILAVGQKEPIWKYGFMVLV